MICDLEWLVLQSRLSVKVRRDRENTAGLLSVALAVFSLTYFVNSIITFIFQVVTLIFLVLAEYESKKIWIKFDNLDLTRRLMERDKKSMMRKIQAIVSATRRRRHIKTTSCLKSLIW